MRPARPTPSFTTVADIPSRIRYELFTNDLIANEVFGSLSFLSEVKSSGLDFLARRGHPPLGINKTFRQFQAFIRQAKAFYDSAESLHYRASPLNYYYSFFNLAKAYIIVETPNFESGKEYHGITTETRGTSLSRQFLVAKRNGVLPKLHKLILDETVTSGTRYSVSQLLAYCRDISYEYEAASFGRHKQLGCKYALILNENKKTAHNIIGVQMFNVIEKYRKTLAAFYRHFEEVDLRNPTARDVFGIMAEQKPSFRFLRALTNTRCWATALFRVGG